MSKKIFELDIYKALAAFMVIIIHVTATPVVSLTSGNALTALLIINRLSKPSVPMFVFASGLALYYVYKDREFSFLEFLKKRFVKILMPYLFFCVIYYAIFIYNGIYAFSVSFFLENIISGKLVYHLYFVIIILQFYLLFGLIQSLVKKTSAYVLLPLAAITSVASILIIPSEWVGRFFGTYALYFILGCYFGKNYAKAIETIMKYKWPLALMFIVAGGIYTYQFYEVEVLVGGYRFINDAYAFLIFSTIAILVYFIAAELIEKTYQNGQLKGTRKTLLEISAASYYIYLAHPLGIILGVSISNRLGISGVIDQMLVSLGIILIAVIPLSIIYVKQKTKYLLKTRSEVDKS